MARSEPPRVNTLFEGRPSVVWKAARGSNVVDVDGNRYVDLTSGFGAAAVGHADPTVVDAIHRQSVELVHGLADVAAHPARVELADRLCALAPLPNARVHFAVSGSDAVEIALKTAQLATGRTGILCLEDAYHGVSIGALAVSSRDTFRRPFANVLRSNVHRVARGAPLDVVDDLLRAHGSELGCVVFEPIAGREGVHLAPAGWLAELVQRSREAGALVVADEIFTGFGRTGPAFAVELEGVTPDLVCVGKALGGGLPIGAVLGSSDVMAAWDGPGEALHTGTFLAQPLACAAALAVLDRLGDGLLDRVGTLGTRVAARLAALESEEGIVECRGRGLLWGIELASAAITARTIELTLADGLLLLASGPAGRVLELVPPYVITDAQLDLSLDILARSIDRAVAETTA
ncbi:MAG: aspartate aminotransferase family protein [Acidobacteriota bacterium]|nr:aspartate aminotransferase family protein [Acidobacteriota bacterium]